MSSDTTRYPTESANVLPLGTRLGEFEIVGMLGIGGFGIVYRAFDHALEREVAVKEYMPAMMAGRTETMHVSLRSQSDAETFALGLRSFVNEAKLLARFDHPALLKVYRFWEANGTAYMAMPVLQGRTFKQIRATMSAPPDEAWLRSVLDPLLGAIEHLHNAGVYHRDIAPDNIQVEPDGHPVLVDFGAARRVITDKTQTLTAILKPSYAPIEQYAEASAVKQGPWTDLYALGATLHFMLLGRPPSPATTRAVIDDVAPLAQMALPGCRPEFLAVIDWMLNPRPVDRPQSVAALREVLDGMSPLPAEATAAAAVAQAAASAAPAAWDRTLLAGRGNPLAATGIQHTDIDLPMAAAATDKSGALDAADLPLDPVDHDATRVVPRPLAALDPAPAPATDRADPRSTTAASATGRKFPALWVGLGVAATVVLAAVLWPRSGETPPPAAAASAPMVAAESAASGSSAASGAATPTQAPTVANAASSAAPPAAAKAAAAPAVGPRPANGPAAAAPATATVDSATARPGSLPPGVKPPPPDKPSPVAGAAPATLAVPSARPTAGPTSAIGGGSTAAAAPTPGAAPAAPGPATAAAPPSAVPAPSAAQPVPTPAAVAGGGVTAAPSEPARPTTAIGPEAKCDGQNPVLYFVCMERECLRSANQNHPDCRKWRQSKPPESR
jgi:hypothetical protein